MSRSNRDELDPNLKNGLEAYGEAAPPRDPAAAKRTSDRFTAELNGMFGADPVSNRTPRSLRAMLGLWTSGLRKEKENSEMSFAKRSTQAIVAAVLVLAVFLFGGGITASAAAGSLPGDALYPVKTSLENARLSLSTDDAVRSSLFLSFAGRRLDEIKSLIADSRFTQVPQAAAEFQKDIEKAQEAIRHLAEDNPARAAELNAQAAVILKGYDDALNAMLAGVPVDVQPVIQGAIDASQSAANSMDNANSNDENGNDITNSNGNSNEDNGNDINSNANSNEDNGNDINSNANSNEDNGNDINSNANSNEDNGNDINSNANSNDDNSNVGNDNGNTNANDNTNTNGNTNTNDNGGSGGGDGGGGGGDGGGGGGDGGGGG